MGHRGVRRAQPQRRQFPAGDNIDAASHVPPVLTKTWFHTGVYLGRDHVSDFFAGLLDANDHGRVLPRARPDRCRSAGSCCSPTPCCPTGLTLEEEREACRALKGSMLRQEVYALGRHGDKASASLHRHRAELHHPHAAAARRATATRVFFTHAREAISYHYERNPADPRIGHALTLEVDDFGNVLKVSRHRLRPAPAGHAQPDRCADQSQANSATAITYTENGVHQLPSSGDDVYRTPLPCETRTYELDRSVAAPPVASASVLSEMLEQRKRRHCHCV